MKFILPFSYPSLIRNALGDAKTVLDAGCGNGYFMTEINGDKKYTVTGVELFSPYIQKAKATGLYKTILKKDIRKLTFEKDSFDAVLSSQVIEHFTKGDGAKVIKLLKKFTKHTLIIGVPNGHFHQEAYDHNHLQEHLSTWYPEDFKKMGFTVYGQGLKYIYAENGLLNSPIGKIPFIRGILFFISYIVSPFVCYHPEYGTYLVAIYKK